MYHMTFHTGHPGAKGTDNIIDWINPRPFNLLTSLEKGVDSSTLGLRVVNTLLIDWTNDGEEPVTIRALGAWEGPKYLGPISIKETIVAPGNNIVITVEWPLSIRAWSDTNGD